MSALISAEELHNMLDDENLRIFDASYNLPVYEDGIPGAQDFDIDDIADPAAPLAHTVPSPEIFAEKVGALGVSKDSAVIVYDRAGVHVSASRAWWLFRLFGHDNVRVLNGGLPAWAAAGYPMEARQNNRHSPATFTPRFRPELLRLKADMQDNIETSAFCVLDARDPARYAGTAPEPRPGMQPGHIPGSLNTPFVYLINPETYGLKDTETLADVFAHCGVDISGKPLATSCGSGVTACVVALALHELGQKDVAVYDGSWTEWGGDTATPKKTGSEP
ncbi:MAG: sulfurtransferase [Alphaproteobacteria bacterium]|nr:sulfurtransferase [Alphaproteobacteria bacterium]